jgi:hypothetical protein
MVRYKGLRACEGSSACSAPGRHFPPLRGRSVPARGLGKCKISEITSETVHGEKARRARTVSAELDAGVGGGTPVCSPGW